MKKAIYILLMIIPIACSKELSTEPVDEGTSSILGYWANPVYSDSLITLDKSSSLIKDAYGFGFLPNGEFIERKISGWCATPPVIYADDKGSWKLKNSLVEIKVAYWGGTATYQWDIKMISSDKLQLIYKTSQYSD